MGDGLARSKMYSDDSEDWGWGHREWKQHGWWKRYGWILAGPFIIIGIAFVIIFPLIFIWALNTLFSLNIAYNFFTWLAALIILGVLMSHHS